MPLNREEKNAIRIVVIVAIITFIVGLILGGLTGVLVMVGVTR